ncbi:MAG: hypothetical protein IRZ16_10315 [Myxococcaceae bacterium]|nr:hypothetical protein [Myxococcaceae bacterium]
MRDRFPLLVVAGLLLFVAAGSYLFRGAARGHFADLLSTHRSEPDGARAIYLLAEESGLHVGRSMTDLEVPRGGAAYVLLAPFFEGTELVASDLFRGDAPDGGAGEDRERELEAEQRGMNRYTAPQVTDDERKKLLEHVAWGHTLIYVPVGDPDDPLLKDLNVTLVPISRGSEGARILVPPHPSPWTLGVRRAKAKARTHLNLPVGAAQLLIDEQLGGTVAALVPHGRGRVVVIAAPELAMNARLADEDNAQLWLSLLRTAAGGPTGVVLFDEFHHGFSDDRSIAEFASRYGLQFAILQLVFGLCLWTIALRRFGRPKVPPEAERIGATDALYAASRIYREGRHHTYAASLLARGLAQDLARHVGLASRASPQEIVSALRTRKEDALATTLEQVTALGARATNDAEVETAATLAANARRTLRERHRRRAVSLLAEPRSPMS